jgi:hypothetical protein
MSVVVSNESIQPASITENPTTKKQPSQSINIKKDERKATSARNLSMLASSLKQSLSVSSSINSRSKSKDRANNWCIDKWLDTHVNNHSNESVPSSTSRSERNKKSRRNKSAHAGLSSTRDENNNETLSTSALSSTVTDTETEQTDHEEKPATKATGQIKVDRRLKDLIGNYLRKNLATDAAKAKEASQSQLPSSTSAPLLNKAAETRPFFKLSQLMRLKARNDSNETDKLNEDECECCSFSNTSVDSDSTILEDKEGHNSVAKLSHVLFRESTRRYLDEQLVNNPQTWSKSAHRETRLKNNLVDSHCHLEMLFHR